MIWKEIILDKFDELEIGLDLDHQRDRFGYDLL
jgi:hypothetical protein